VRDLYWWDAWPGPQAGSRRLASHTRQWEAGAFAAWRSPHTQTHLPTFQARLPTILDSFCHVDISQYPKKCQAFRPAAPYRFTFMMCALSLVIGPRPLRITHPLQCLSTDAFSPRSVAVGVLASRPPVCITCPSRIVSLASQRPTTPGRIDGFPVPSLGPQGSSPTVRPVNHERCHARPPTPVSLPISKLRISNPKAQDWGSVGQPDPCPPSPVLPAAYHTPQ